MNPTVPFIDLATQQKRIKKDLDTRIQKVLDHGQYIGGPEIGEVEQKLAKLTGAKHCITVANGTDALQIAMMALDIKHGDEVITPAFTFFATGEMIAVLGGVPIFCDIDAQTYNIDPTLIEKKISAKTKAIIPVGLYGQVSDMKAINSIAQKFNIPVIEDAAQTLGATQNGIHSCNLSEIGCTSFFPSKSLGCYGDGGACFTNNDELAQKMKWIRSHGQERRYHHKVIGLNSRFDTIQAAVLLSKLEIFDQEIKDRKRIGERYSKLLEGVVKTPKIEAQNTSVYAQYTIEVEDRERVVKSLELKGIPTAIHYPLPLHIQPAMAYLNGKPGDYPVSEKAAKKVLSLPMHPYLSEQQQDWIVLELKKAVLN